MKKKSLETNSPTTPFLCIKHSITSHLAINYSKRVVSTITIILQCIQHSIMSLHSFHTLKSKYLRFHKLYKIHERYLKKKRVVNHRAFYSFLYFKIIKMNMIVD